MAQSLTYHPARGRGRSRRPRGPLRLALLVGGLVATAVIAGCTSTTSDSAPPTSAPAPSGPTTGADAFDVCELFPAAEVEEVLGATQIEPGPGGGWAAGTCTLNAEGVGLLISAGTGESFAAAADPGATDPASRFAAHEQELTEGGEEPTTIEVGEGGFVHAGGGAAFTEGVYIEIVAPGAPADQVEEVLALGIANAPG